MSLTEWELDNRNQPLFSFYGEDATDWVLDAPYQRQPVWTLEDQRELMRSVFEHLPIGAVYVNRRGWGEPTLQVVDGQQRIRAIRAFRADEVGLPVDWFEDEALRLPREAYLDGMVTYSDLTKRWQFSRFEMFPVAVYWTNLPTVENEAELYLRLNRAGVAQSAADLARAATVAGLGHPTSDAVQTEWEQVSATMNEWRAWFQGSNLSKPSSDRALNVIVREASLAGWLASRGLDFERALHDEADRARAELERMQAETGRKEA